MANIDVECWFAEAQVKLRRKHGALNFCSFEGQWIKCARGGAKPASVEDHALVDKRPCVDGLCAPFPNIGSVAHVLQSMLASIPMQWNVCQVRQLCMCPSHVGIPTLRPHQIARLRANVRSGFFSGIACQSVPPSARPQAYPKRDWEHFPTTLKPCPTSLSSPHPLKELTLGGSLNV